MKQTTKKHGAPRPIIKRLSPDLDVDEPLDTSIGDDDDQLAWWRMINDCRDQELELRTRFYD